ncbi:lipid-A-disaccharide synthase [Tropicimonas sp. IMCC34011]|uniref:lipid-A-disaccharide synthase n=1 Tax=Tropicimonas sp. IMCC34011 TaxID=2248759 RepID=UPI000E287417|nr:lipid-A-disaccharide synthase [Tropicimonas sp. IMCC34011]
MTHVFVIAGEASGDTLGAGLIAGLRARDPSLVVSGVGGPKMAAEGLTSLFDMDDLSVMGLAEVLARYPLLRRRLNQTIAAGIEAAPDVVIGIDSPDFCLRAYRGIRAARPEQRIVHYVAPSVWAWRPGRARKMARDVDQVLALLPFEPPYMEAAGMECDVVGHPAARAPVASKEAAEAFRARHDIDGPLLTVLPGSRTSEITRLAEPFGEALKALGRRGLRVVVPVAPGKDAEVARATSDWPGNPILLPPNEVEDRRAALVASDVALAASGTVSLELARAGLPIVIAYDMAPLSRWIISRMLQVDTVTLVNLVSESRVVPEFIGKNCRPAGIAGALAHLLDDAKAREAQLDVMALTMERLGANGPPPGDRAAEAVLRRLAD